MHYHQLAWTYIIVIPDTLSDMIWESLIVQCNEYVAVMRLVCNFIITTHDHDNSDLCHSYVLLSPEGKAFI